MHGSRLEESFVSILRCPEDHSRIEADGAQLVCEHGHRHAVVQGVPILLPRGRRQTIDLADKSLAAYEGSTDAPLFLNTLGLSESQIADVARDYKAGAPIDAAISYLIGATSGYGYVDRVGRLDDYPIPDIPLGAGEGRLLLDIGSSWGRWSVSAARKGWRVIGLDPSLGALLAARRAFSRLGLDMTFVCGDARVLPFKSDAFAAGFSYSVIQHFSEADAATALAELGRVLRSGGLAKIQMAHRGGLRSTYIRTRPNYRDSGVFGVRYWSLSAMEAAFRETIGPPTITPEAFGGLGLLREDWTFASLKAKALIAVSSMMKTAARLVPALAAVADSVYVEARKP